MIKPFRLLSILAACALFTSGSAVNAQDNFRVMCYNLLNFPGGTIANRVDTLKQIVEYVQPDLLLVQELVSASGLESIKNNAFDGFSDEYATSTFVPNQSLPMNQLQQAIVYNTRSFGIADEWIQTTHLRDINIVKLYFNEDALEMGGDTTFLYVFNTHMKASSGFDNEQERLDMAEEFVDALSTLPDDSYVLFGGDFNLYYGNEPAYQLLMNTNVNITMEDPIDAPGNWGSSSYPFKEVHTQSTRANQVFGDGAGGGVDDRFDFILVSSNLKNSSSPVRYKTGSYKALGNNGSCYNQNITDCNSTGNEVPYPILSAMYHFSDHLPVIMDIETDFSIGVNDPFLAKKPTPPLYSHGNTIFCKSEDKVNVRDVIIFDLNGRMLMNLQITPGESKSLSTLANGLYLVQSRATSTKGAWVSQKLFIINN